MLAQLLPKAHPDYRSLPILGRYVDEFVNWCHSRGHSVASLKSHLRGVRHFARDLRRLGCKKFKDLAAPHFAMAVRRKSSHKRSAIRTFRRFLQEMHSLALPPLKPVSGSEAELTQVILETPKHPLDPH